MSSGRFDLLLYLFNVGILWIVLNKTFPVLNGILIAAGIKIGDSEVLKCLWMIRIEIEGLLISFDRFVHPVQIQIRGTQIGSHVDIVRIKSESLFVPSSGGIISAHIIVGIPEKNPCLTVL